MPDGQAVRHFLQFFDDFDAADDMAVEFFQLLRGTQNS